MPDPHSNLFYQYRRAAGSDTEAVNPRTRERQLEDNLTKAFVNTLELGGPALLGAFLRMLTPPVPALSAKSDTALISYRLQGFLDDISRARTRRVVIIAPARAQTATRSDQPDPRSSRPDASIYVASTGTGIVIESKLASPVDEDQITRHTCGAGWEQSVAHCRLDWSSVADRFLEAVADERVGDRARLLAEQFADFVDLAQGSAGMAEFDGITQADFDYFLSHPPEYTPVIRHKLEEFARAVHAEALPSAIRNQYPDVRMGPITHQPGAGAWVKIGKDPNRAKGDSFRNCNLMIAMDSARVTLNGVLRDQRVTKKGFPIAELWRSLKERHPTLMLRLGALGADYWLVIHRRIGRNDGPPNRLGETWIPAAEISLGLSAEAVRNSALPILGEIDFPGIHIRTSIPRGDVRLIDRNTLLREAAASLVDIFEVMAAVDPALTDA